MLDTVPSCTPRKLTGDPTVSPATLPSKAITQVTGRLNHWRPPRSRTATTVSAIPPSTNAPIRVGFGRLAIAAAPHRSGLLGLPAGEKGAHLRVRALGEQCPGIAPGRHRAGLGVEEDRVIADGEDAGQLVRHHHHGAAQAAAQLED